MNITDQIISSPEGGTVSLTGDALPTTGYYVGGKVSALVIDGYLVDQGRKLIDAFIELVNSPDVGAEYLGWWTDEETGKLYVDATTHVRGYFKAEELCLERGEIAFYDIEIGRSFRPVKDGE